jgi:hypothetical protein
MRAYIIAAGLALLVVGNARGTVVDNGADAQKACRLFVDGSSGDTDGARAAGACEGMIETAMVFSPNMPADTRACAPAQGSALESAKALLRYLDKSPERVSEAGISLAIEALRDAWPCEGDDAGVPGGSKSLPKPKKRAAKKPAGKPAAAPASVQQQ